VLRFHKNKIRDNINLWTIYCANLYISVFARLKLRAEEFKNFY